MNVGICEKSEIRLSVHTLRHSNKTFHSLPILASVINFYLSYRPLIPVDSGVNVDRGRASSL